MSDRTTCFGERESPPARSKTSRNSSSATLTSLHTEGSVTLFCEAMSTVRASQTQHVLLSTGKKDLFNLFEMIADRPPGQRAGCLCRWRVATAFTGRNAAPQAGRQCSVPGTQGSRARGAEKASQCAHLKTIFSSQVGCVVCHITDV